MTTLLSGKYRVDDEIARGGMGTLYKGVHTALGRPVAIKALHPEYGLDPDFRRRFLREARALARLDHPHIIRVFDVEEDQVGQYLIMELFPGRDLKKLLRERGRLSVEEVLSIGLQVADALAYAHSREIIHRDIKPGNVLIDDDRHVKLVDFGIAAGGGDMPVTKTGQILGTPQYMAPEQARGEEADERTDLYALGIVLHELLTGRTPYHGLSSFEVFEKLMADQEDRVIELPPDVPQSLEDLIRRLFHKRKEDRPANARILSTEIGAIAEELSSPVDGRETEPEPEPEPELEFWEADPEPRFSFQGPLEEELAEDDTTLIAQPGRRRTLRRAVVAASLVVVVVLAAGVFWWMGLPGGPEPDSEGRPKEGGTTSETVPARLVDEQAGAGALVAVRN